MKNYSSSLKLAPFALVVLLVFAGISKCNAQSDSTTIKLDHYKQMFINGTITSQEYETLRKQTLGINTAPNKTTLSQEQINSLQVKYIKNKKAGIGLLATGGGLLILGSAFISSALSTSSGSEIFFTGIACYGASLPLVIAGGVCMSKYVKHKRQWKESKPSIAIAPNGVALTF